MEYEKAYKEALERAREFQKSKDGLCVLTAESIFPELKESEDERIRKELLESFKYQQRESRTDKEWLNGIKLSEVIAWLEKQKSVGEIVERCKNSWYNEGKIAGMAEGLTDDEKYQQGWHDALEKQGEKKPINDTDEEIVKARLWDITKDAKDGDVLYSLDSKQPFIFKHRKPNEQAEAYCGLNIYGKFFVWGTKDCVITLSNYIPATKEQRDLLFQKMKEDGYEWDAEKKELKKIHVIDEGKAEMDYCFTKMMAGEKANPTWNVEDSSKVQRICQYLDEAKKYYADITEVRECIEWLKSIEDRVQPKPTEWSEDDERIVTAFMEGFRYHQLFNPRFGEVPNAEIISWIKSLKERLS